MRLLEEWSKTIQLEEAMWPISGLIKHGVHRRLIRCPGDCCAEEVDRQRSIMVRLRIVESGVGHELGTEQADLMLGVPARLRVATVIGSSACSCRHCMSAERRANNLKTRAVSAKSPLRKVVRVHDAFWGMEWFLVEAAGDSSPGTVGILLVEGPRVLPPSQT